MLYWISPKSMAICLGLEWESNVGSTLFQATSKDISVFMVHGLWMMCTMKT